MLYRLIHILVFLCMLLGLEMAPGQCGARGDMMLPREPASGQRGPRRGCGAGGRPGAWEVVEVSANSGAARWMLRWRPAKRPRRSGRLWWWRPAPGQHALHGVGVGRIFHQRVVPPDI
jgi:hypothetical protein